MIAVSKNITMRRARFHFQVPKTKKFNYSMAMPMQIMKECILYAVRPEIVSIDINAIRQCQFFIRDFRRFQNLKRKKSCHKIHKIN